MVAPECAPTRCGNPGGVELASRRACNSPAPHRRAAGRARQTHTSRIRAGAAADPEQETTMLSPRLPHFLDERHAAYTTLSHDRTITAQETANCAHIGNRHFAKTVMLKVDGDLAMMVMPAAYRIDLTRLSRALGGREVEIGRAHV